MEKKEEKTNRNPTIDDRHARKFKIDHALLGNHLLVFCTHSNSNASQAMLYLKMREKAVFTQSESHAIPDYLSYIDQENSEELHNHLKEWLKEELEKITKAESKIERVTFAADVNLGRPGECQYPEFLFDDFIRQNFDPFPVEKILFSSDDVVVERAKQKYSDPKDILIINSYDLLKAMKNKVNPAQEPNQSSSATSGLFKRAGDDKLEERDLPQLKHSRSTKP